MRAAGIMSGTSLDGIDVAIVETTPRLTLLAHSSAPYPAKVRAAILAVSDTRCHTADISRLNFLLPELYAKAVHSLCRKAGIPIESLDVIGCHGQTIFHEAAPARGIPPNTLQIGDGSVLAERTGVTVVSDFRPRDMAAGGKGAPLVPFLDLLLFRNPRRTSIALNIGGIANISVIPPKARPGQVIAFDTGPGNMVMDQLVTRHTNGKSTYDRNGRLAAQGQVSLRLLDDLLTDPYYRKPPPKTAGREQYGEAFIARLLATGLAIPDLIATAATLTAATIAEAIQRFADSGDVYAAGGGVHNRRLMELLAALLPGFHVRDTSEVGIPADVKEAVAFAVMAAETIRHRPSNVPSATGASHPAILGKISPAPRRRVV